MSLYAVNDAELNNNIIMSIINKCDIDLMYYLLCSNPYNDVTNCIKWHIIAMDNENVFAYSIITDIIKMHKCKHYVNVSIHTLK